MYPSSFLVRITQFYQITKCYSGITERVLMSANWHPKVRSCSPLNETRKGEKNVLYYKKYCSKSFDQFSTDHHIGKNSPKGEYPYSNMHYTN